MSVYRPDGCKIYQIDFWYKERRYCRSSGTRKFAAAKREEKLWKARLREAQQPSFLRPKLGKSFKAVWADYYNLVGQSTANADALHAMLLVADGIVGSDTPLGAIDDHMMLEFRERYRRLPSDRTRTRGSRENSSVNDFTRLIFRIINYAKNYLHEELTLPKPAKWLLPETGRMRELGVDEEKKLEMSSEPEIRRIWMFVIETGLRRKPACGLRWDQVDMELKKITVVEKGKKRHVVPLSDFALEILRSVWGDHDTFVFTRIAKRDCSAKRTSYGEGDRIEIKPGYFWKAFNAALGRAKIQDFTVHDLRHTAATRLLRVCGNIVIIQRFLGHTTLKQTIRYIHMVQEDVAGAVAMNDIARLKKNLAKVAELKALPKEFEAVGLNHLFLALDLRNQLDAYLAGSYRRAA